MSAECGKGKHTFENGILYINGKTKVFRRVDVWNEENSSSISGASSSTTTGSWDRNATVSMREAELSYESHRMVRVCTKCQKTLPLEMPPRVKAKSRLADPDTCSHSARMADGYAVVASVSKSISKSAPRIKANPEAEDTFELSLRSDALLDLDAARKAGYSGVACQLPIEYCPCCDTHFVRGAEEVVRAYPLLVSNVQLLLS